MLRTSRHNPQVQRAMYALSQKAAWLNGRITNLD